MNILLYTLSVPLGFGVMSLLITYLFSKPILVWCRKRWVRVFKKYENNTGFTDYLFEHLALDQMKSLYFEVLFTIIFVSAGIALISFSLFFEKQSGEIFYYSLFPFIPIIFYIRYVKIKKHLFVEKYAFESQLELSQNYWKSLTIVSAIGCIIVYAFFKKDPYGIIYFIPPIWGIVCLIGSLVLFALGRLGIIQINKRYPLPFHAQQTDLLIQALLLSRPEFTRQWLKTNMDHENPKIASFARKWTERYL